MADGVEVTEGTGTVIATDDVSSVHYQVIKLGLGADGAIDTLVDSGQQAMAASIPVVIASDQTALTVSSHAVTNAGTFAVQLTEGGVTADILDLTNSNPLTVAIVDGSGDQISSFGGGTQYTEGATDASITGTALLWEDAADTLVTASSAKPFPVEIIAGAGSGGTAAADDADFTDGTTSGTPGMGVYESTPTTVTDGDLGIFGITIDRQVKVSDAAGAALLTTIDADTSAMAVSLAALDNAVAGNELQVDVLTMPTVAVTQSGAWDEVGIHDSGNSITVDNGGTFAVQVDGSALTALQLIDDIVFVDDAAFTPGASKVAAIGLQADEGSTDSVDEGDIGAPRMTLDRKQITTPQPHTAGGLAISRDIDLDNGTLTVVKNAPGQVYGWTITNTTTAVVYVKFYDATSGTLGTGTPVLTIGIPGNATDDTTLAQSFGGMGIAFATGICVGAGTAVADADNTDPGANGVIANIFYK
jgi:hypothetical protein